MQSFLRLIIAVLCMLPLCSESVAQPTYTNATGEYYISTWNSFSDFQGQVIICSAGVSNCYVVCDQYSACKGTKISASSGTKVSVSCSDEESCQDLKFDGSKLPSLSITCASESACFSSTWSANGTSAVNIVCDSTNTFASVSICGSAKFQVAGSTSVKFECEGESACFNTELLVAGVKSVTVKAAGQNALHQSKIHGFAESLDLSCEQASAWQTDLEWNSCVDNDIYVPSKFSLNCYGHACQQLGDLKVQSSTSLANAKVYFNGCGECENAEDCAPQSTISCDYAASKGTWDTVAVWNGDSGDCDYPKNCGCGYIANKTQTMYTVDESVCPTIDAGAIVGMLVGVMVAIIAGSVCCCVLICVCIYFACCRAPKRNTGLLVGAQYVQQPAIQPNVVVLNPNQLPQTQPPAQSGPYMPPPQQQVVVQPQVVTAAPTDGSVNAYPRL